MSRKRLAQSSSRRTRRIGLNTILPIFLACIQRASGCRAPITIHFHFGKRDVSWLLSIGRLQVGLCRSCRAKGADAGATLNHALFVDTEGYVLKPLSLRQKIVEPITRYSIRVSIISAQRLPLSSDLYVEAFLGGATRRTACAPGRALNPIWNESFSFTVDCTPSMLELQFLRLEIRKPNDKPVLAQWMRTLSASPKGYQYLPLYDALFSKFVFATLFVRIDVEEAGALGGSSVQSG